MIPRHHSFFCSLSLSSLGQYRVKCKTEGGRHGKDSAAYARETALNASRFVKYKSGYKG